MSRTYDSGLEAPIRTLIRNAVITTLAPLAAGPSNAAGFLEAIIPIGFSVSASDLVSIDLLFQELAGRSPAIAVAAIEMKFTPGGAPDRSIGNLAIDLYFVSTHRAGVTEGRTAGDAAADLDLTADPGIDVALELAWQQLFNAELGIGPRANPLILLRETEVMSDDQKTVWMQSWECRCTRDVNLVRAISQKLTNLRTRLFEADDLLATLNLAAHTTHIDTILRAKATRGDSISVQTIPRTTGLAPWVTFAENLTTRAVTLTYERNVATVADLELAVAASALVAVGTPGTPGNVLTDPADVMAATLLVVPKSTIVETTTVG